MLPRERRQIRSKLTPFFPAVKVCFMCFVFLCFWMQIWPEYPWYPEHPNVGSTVHMETWLELVFQNADHNPSFEFYYFRRKIGRWAFFPLFCVVFFKKRKKLEYGGNELENAGNAWELMRQWLLVEIYANENLCSKQSDPGAPEHARDNGHCLLESERVLTKFSPLSTSSSDSNWVPSLRSSNRSPIICLCAWNKMENMS